MTPILPIRLAMLGVLALGASLLSPAPAHAQIKLPNGTVIPINGGPSLSGYINGSANNDNINEGINVVNDAATEPQVFSPLCDFAGKYIAKGGGANFAIGWYNVDNARASTNPPKYVPVDMGANLNVAAAASDIFILFPFSSNLPTNRDLTAASIRNDTHYKGGLIGFVLVPNPTGTGNGNATQYHYTEHRFNVQCTKCTAAGETQGPWYSHLIYKSKKLDNTFYLGFEDLDFRDASGAAGVNGNDLDYEDFLFRFTGIACMGAGQPCPVPNAKGACAVGVTECNQAGALACKALTQPGQRTEICDGVDNDCNGSIDDNAPCPTGQTCSRGRCTTSCSGEFPCGDGLTCERGRCVDSDCIGKTCNEGDICRKGSCVNACTGIKCPAPYSCSGGVCIDPCTGVDCGAGKVCANGACVTKCDCLPCSAGQACQTSSGKCVDSGCQNMSCGAGDTCSAGSCVAVCADAICPPNQKCEAGKCIDSVYIEPPPPNEDGMVVIPGGAVETGCSCRFAPGQDAGSALGFGAAALLLALALYRRRLSA